MVAGTPKTKHSRRPVDLPAGVLPALHGHQLREKERSLADGRRWADDALIFSTSEWKPLDPGYIRRAFEGFLRRTGLPRVRIHHLRHTAATCHFQMGAHPRVVQEMLGHSSIGLTLDTYSHYVPTLHQEAAQRMDRLFGAREVS